MKKRRSAGKAAPLLAALLIFACLLAVFALRQPVVQPETNGAAQAASAPESDSLEVHFLDIGQGDSALLFCGGETMLIDGGKVKSNQTLISRLRELGVEHLNTIICSHPDEDHCGGLSAVLAGLTADTFYCSVDSWHTKAFSDVVKYADEQQLSITIPQPGDSFSFGGASVTFLGPVQDYGDDPNEGSLVARVQYGSTSVLFTGDMGFEAEDDMLAADVDVSATVLKVAHHGSAGSSSREFLEAVSPQYAVISVGADNDYGHPTEAALNRLKKCGIPVYRTDLLGEIVAVCDGQHVTITYGEQASSTENSAAPEEESFSYVGNRSSMVVHSAACGRLPAEGNRVYFKTLDEALAAGYRRHANCLGDSAS